MIDFFTQCKSGKFLKEIFLKKNYPEIYKKIFNYSNDKTLNFLPFKYKIGLFIYGKENNIIGDNIHLLNNIKIGFLKNKTIPLKSFHKTVDESTKELVTIFKSYGLQDNSGIVKQILSNGNNDHLIKVLEEKTKKFDIINPNLRQRIWLFKNMIKEIPKCICGNNLNLKTTSCGWTANCGDKKCFVTLQQMRMTQTNLIKYGVPKPTQTDEVKQKISSTLERNGHIRYRSKEELNNFQEYKKQVRLETEKKYRKFKNIINPNNYERGRGKYHIDHKISIFKGFERGLTIEEMVDVDNLQMLTEKENLNKNKY